MTLIEPQTNEQECRICLEPTETEDLISPCLCRGSQLWVHRRCLDLWRSPAVPFHDRDSKRSSQYYKCSICKFHYKFSYENCKVPKPISIFDEFTKWVVLLFMLILEFTSKILTVTLIFSVICLNIYFLHIPMKLLIAGLWNTFSTSDSSFVSNIIEYGNTCVTFTNLHSNDSFPLIVSQAREEPLTLFIQLSRCWMAKNYSSFWYFPVSCACSFTLLFLFTTIGFIFVHLKHGESEEGDVGLTFTPNLVASSFHDRVYRLVLSTVCLRFSLLLDLSALFSSQPNPNNASFHIDLADVALSPPRFPSSSTSSSSSSSSCHSPLSSSSDQTSPSSSPSTSPPALILSSPSSPTSQSPPPSKRFLSSSSQADLEPLSMSISPFSLLHSLFSGLLWFFRFFLLMILLIWNFCLKPFLCVPVYFMVGLFYTGWLLYQEVTESGKRYYRLLEVGGAIGQKPVRVVRNLTESERIVMNDSKN